MSNPSFASDLPLGLRAGDVKTSLAGWGAYMAILTVYCTIYQVVVSGAAPDLAGTFLYVLREWAIWCFVTPVALKALWHFEPRPGRLIPYLHVGAGILLATIAFRLAVDYLTEARGAGSILLIYVPRYLAVVVALFLIWHFFLRKRRSSASQPDPAAAPQELNRGDEREPWAYPQFLMASKGNGKCPVPLNRIECISAAGNYVEIASNDRRYLMRSTMKQVEGVLPPSMFIRVHRSHIVNLNEIDRIKSRPSGNGTVFLRSGSSVNISKRYRNRLEKPPLRAE